MSAPPSRLRRAAALHLTLRSAPGCCSIALHTVHPMHVAFDDARKLLYVAGGSVLTVLGAGPSDIGAGAPALPKKGFIDFAALDVPAGARAEGALGRS